MDNPILEAVEIARKALDRERESFERYLDSRRRALDSIEEHARQLGGIEYWTERPESVEQDPEPDSEPPGAGGYIQSPSWISEKPEEIYVPVTRRADDSRVDPPGDEPEDEPPAPAEKPVVPPPDPDRRRPLAPRNPPVDDRHPDRRAERVLALVRELEPVRTAQLRGVLEDWSIGELQASLHRLRDHGRIRSTGHSRTARWHLTETLDRQTAERSGTKGRSGGGRAHRLTKIRETILDLTRERPGSWSEEEIVKAYDFDREDVADICGELILLNRIELLPDGTYRPSENGSFAQPDDDRRQA